MTPPQPRKAHPIDLASDVTRRAAAARALHEAHAHFLFNASALVRASGPEFLHQARVGLRRLRVFVRLFRAQLGKKRALRLEAELRWLFGELGRVRDLQVFAKQTLPTLDLPTRARHALETRIEAELRAGATQLAEALDSPRFHALCRELASIEAKLETRGEHQKRLRGWLARRLRRRRDRVLAAGHALNHGDDTALHELRKQLKKLRYASELETVFEARPKRRAAYQHTLKALQEILGELNDLSVGRRLLPLLLPARPARAKLVAQLDQHYAQALARMSPRLKRFAREKPSWN